MEAKKLLILCKLLRTVGKGIVELPPAVQILQFGKVDKVEIVHASIPGRFQVAKVLERARAQSDAYKNDGIHGNILQSPPQDGRGHLGNVVIRQDQHNVKSWSKYKVFDQLMGHGFEAIFKAPWMICVAMTIGLHDVIQVIFHFSKVVAFVQLTGQDGNVHVSTQTQSVESVVESILSRQIYRFCRRNLLFDNGRAAKTRSGPHLDEMKLQT